MHHLPVPTMQKEGLGLCRVLIITLDNGLPTLPRVCITSLKIALWKYDNFQKLYL